MHESRGGARLVRNNCYSFSTPQSLRDSSSPHEEHPKFLSVAMLLIMSNMSKVLLFLFKEELRVAVRS